MDQKQATRRAFVTSLARAVAGVGFLPALPRAFAAANGVTIRKHPEMIVRSPSPLDLETPVHLLDSWITPNEAFYVRSHLPTPEVDITRWRLAVDGAVERRLALSIDELKQFPKVEGVVTMECAGNGRALFRPRMAGAQWVRGAVGTARWAGVRLADVLQKAGAGKSGLHVAFEAADQPIGNVPDFLRSVPIEKCLQPATVLAYEMNGEPLPVQHGFPLRVIVPGWEGAACVKWLTGLRVQDREADGPFMQVAYRYPTRPVAPGEAVSPGDMRVLTSVEVKSLITHPRRGARFRPGDRVEVRGNAWSGEAEVARVEVSVDLGRTWTIAPMGQDRAPFAWRRFRYEWKAPERGSYVLMSRATDSAGRAQPIVPQWNPSGYLYNALDQVRIEVAAGAAAPAYDPAYDDVRASPASLPPGPGREVADGACLACHDGTLITQQALSRERWAAEVDKMIRWGAPVSNEQRERLIDYLFSNFPE